MMIGGRRGRVFAAAKPTDLRKSFDTLAKLVTEEMGLDVLCGDAFLFVNARANRAKVLYYDGTGLVILMKRMERDRFAASWKRSVEGRSRCPCPSCRCSSKEVSSSSSVLCRRKTWSLGAC